MHEIVASDSENDGVINITWAPIKTKIAISRIFIFSHLINLEIPSTIQISNHHICTFRKSIIPSENKLDQQEFSIAPDQFHFRWLKYSTSKVGMPHKRSLVSNHLYWNWYFESKKMKKNGSVEHVYFRFRSWWRNFHSRLNAYWAYEAVAWCFRLNSGDSYGFIG